MMWATVHRTYSRINKHDRYDDSSELLVTVTPPQQQPTYKITLTTDAALITEASVKNSINESSKQQSDKRTAGYNTSSDHYDSSQSRKRKQHSTIKITKAEWKNIYKWQQTRITYIVNKNNKLDSIEDTQQQQQQKMYIKEQ